MMKNKLLVLSIASVLGTITSSAANATDFVTTYDGTTHGGATGTITFDDWGYTGPGGRAADNYEPINGFGANASDPTGGIGQIQHVVTREHDWLTPDSPQTLLGDISIGGPYVNANMDTGVNFFQWGYTSPGGSTFNNMQIDYDGDYHVAQNDMSFEFYNYLDYQQVGTAGSLPDGRYYTSLAFQPYTLSDAKGWCGSVLASHPNALEGMAGQLTFDFAFDVYYQLEDFVNGGYYYVYSSTEIVNDFKMGSYGDLTVDVETADGGVQQFTSRAVVNNTNPTTGNTDASATAPVDPDFHNVVSFHGADVVPGNAQCGQLSAEWVAGDRGAGIKKFSSLIDGPTDAASCTTAGGFWQSHAFSGFSFILRADGDRIIDYFDEEVYGPDPFAPVPVPAAVWLFGSGLIGLAGVLRRKRA